MDTPTPAASQNVQASSMPDGKSAAKKMPLEVEVMEGITFAVILITVSVLYAQTLRAAFGFGGF